MLTKNKYGILTFFITLAILFVFYHEVLLDPNNHLFASNGDGLKNYYTYLFHARYDNSFWDFGGMNYPFYEHIVYTDAHPLLSWIIAKLGLVNYGIGILNVLMLISYPIASFFIYKIFRHYSLPIKWSLISAIVLTFMSPQVFRMTGHFSMAYVFAIPIMWWLLIKCSGETRLKWSIVISLYMTAFFFTHPYLGMILAFFSVFFWIGKMLADKEALGNKIVKVLIQIFLPFLIFQGGILLTDTHLDRMATPTGFYHYYANIKSLVLAHHGPMNYVNYFFGWKKGNWESWAYLGLHGVVFFGLINFYLVQFRKKINFKKLFKSEMGIFLIASFAILLFSFCIPMKWDMFRWMADVIGPLKQFRVLGRFAWIFFYVFSVFSIVGLYKVGVARGKEKLFSVIFSVGMLFAFFEFVPTHLSVSKSISQAENTFKTEALNPDIQNTINFLQENEYDAFIFIPFHHGASENVVIMGKEKANYQSMMISYHSGLPMLNSMTSRMSVTEATLFNNFFGPEFIERELNEYLPKDAKIAIIKNQEYLKVEELNLEWSSTKVYENPELTVFDYEPERWSNPIYFNSIVNLEKESIFEVGEGFKSDTNDVWYYSVNYDENNNHHLLGGGALHEKKNSWNVLLTLDNSIIDYGEYSISFWYDIRADRPDGLCVIEQVFYGDKEAIWFDQFDIKQSTHIVNDWCRIQMDFALTKDMEKINVLHTGNNSQEPFNIDELLIQKQNDHPLFKRVIIDREEYIFYNNYLIKANSFSK